ncbi:tigger transposable element-derived protein 6 [Elysia marginata]|uniref:Tigger transposable element-derived protein 6 n=1 Tax=Elysia marginata TaxID=1093978 RepID=A0AAV4FDQ0_9GAST|nr:tigger transposable element-derived protein 6 [Elysia marginata]
MQEKALQFATDLGITTFVASNGWLQSFVKRNNLAFGKLCGESGDVDGDVVTAWKERLPKLIEGYDERYIFKTSADKSFYIKGEKCGGGKKSKERIIISLCANLLGEKEELIVIGKSARPRAFGSLNISDLPVIYKNLRKAWMTTEIFTHWLMGFNEKMKQQNRHVLLFLDNAPAHPTKQFSNVKLQFFPANTTSVLQPLDQGVIQAVKLRYRKAQFRYMMTEMEADAGFSPSNDLTADEEIDIPEELNTLSLTIVGVNFAELPTIDADINICDTEEVDWSKSATDLLINSSVKEDENSEEEDEAEREENCERINLQEAFSGFNKCRNFF